ncbi:non-homologous end-joining DNA ligase [Streptomyces zagrosensis]|uniref:Bifunctional non-homologous end joining protein LigD n=1 Tax=Streptomyces zagrosensis TaxID=1042984 RepID=A0A7W9QDA2_9ACTN|nr:non-homologous end-joining DNA ligase [Streptomyces zagrosensis]MBB5937092.1 bifunctional non-homologous end joining protein LigD [Streptomyces zagrosensis]
MSAAPDRQAVQVDGHRLALTHLRKTLFPASEHTKAELLHYYARIAELMLPHTTDRAASFVRAPDGVEGERWYAKNPPPGAPEWVTITSVPGTEGPAPYVVVDSTATLVAMANLGAYEVHVPQWTTSTGPDVHDRIVFDLDPGPGTDVTDCCRVALPLRDALAADGLTACAVTSGSKGLHLYVPLEPTPGDAAVAYAKRMAGRMRAQLPDLAVATMARAARHGKVFIDWSQNTSAKTTAAPYTLRVRDRPGVATPIDWDEVASCEQSAVLRFGPDEVLERIDGPGPDPLAPLTDKSARAPLPDD